MQLKNDFSATEPFRSRAILDLGRKTSSPFVLVTKALRKNLFRRHTWHCPPRRTR